MHQGSMRYNEADQVYIAACLSRTPKGVVGIAARDQRGQPAVIINLPLIHENGQCLPFPTLYWLVDPKLNAAISDIERKGGVREIEAALAQSDQRMHDHRADNKAYAQARWALMNDKEKQAAAESGLCNTLQTTGIGGVANHDTIKCLHAQYAYHLARHDTGTTAGRLMQQRYGF